MPTPSRAERGRRVAFFDDHPHMDAGATRWTRTVAVELLRRGWRASIIFPHEGIAVQRARAAGVPVHIVASPPVLRRYGRRLTPPSAAAAVVALPAYWVRLAAVLRRTADVVHVGDHRGLVVAGPASCLARRPMVWHVHSAHSSKTLNRVGSRLAGAVVVPSEATRQASPGLPPSVTCLPNAVDARWFTTSADRPPEAIPTVVTVGRLHPIKGFDVLLEAVALMRSSGDDLRLVVVGGPQAGHEQYAADLHQLTTALGIDDIVHFAGAVDDVASHVRAASVYAQPSRFEPGGLAALEAMACGLPVVASAVGGLRETVDDPQTGWLVPPEDPRALADALRAALRDPEEAVRRGAAGRRRASMFTVGPLVDRLELLYDAVLAGR